MVTNLSSPADNPTSYIFSSGRMEETENEHKYFPVIEQPQSNEADTLIGYVNDKANESNKQKKKLLTWLQRTQRKRDENNQRIFLRYLDLIAKNKFSFGNVKSEPSRKRSYSVSHQYCPDYAFYTTTTHPMHVPENRMLSDQKFYSNHMQQPVVLCCPYCLQNQAYSFPAPSDIHVTNEVLMTQSANSGRFFTESEDGPLPKRAKM